MDSVADVLRKAADLIEPEGAWTQGDYYRRVNGNLSMCVLAALRIAGGACRDDTVAKAELAQALGVESVSDWNDAPDRTQAEVVAALRAAADQVERHG